MPSQSYRLEAIFQRERQVSTRGEKQNSRRDLSFIRGSGFKWDNHRQRWSIVMRRDKGGRRMTNEPRSPSPRFLCSFIFIARHGCRVSIVNPRISLLSWLLPCRTNTPATHIQRSSFQREIWICLVEQGTLFLHLPPLLLRDPMPPSRVQDRDWRH